MLNLTDTLLDIDPVHFVDRVLRIKGTSFGLNATGRDYLCGFYRHLAYKTMRPEGRPVVVVKGRQIELTTTMIGFVLYLMGSGYVGEDDIIERDISSLPIGRWPYHHLTVCYTFPTQEQCSRFYNDNEKLLGMMKSSHKGVLDKLREWHGKQSLGHTQFKFMNQLYLTSIWGEASSARGFSADMVIFDEIQDTTETAIANTRKVLTTSQIKAEAYLGTPNITNSFFDLSLWQRSSQQFFHYKCVRCDELFLLAPHNWMDIWKEKLLVECPKCKKLQSKLEASKQGQWIATQNDSQRVLYDGFHFSQILHPTITKEYIINEKERNPEMSFNNEVLGLFYTGLEKPLTFAEIIEKCAIPNAHLMYKTHVLPPRQTFMGIDWGGGSAKVDRKSGDGGDAFTVVVIVSYVDGKYQIEFAHLFQEASTSEQLERISEWIKLYNCLEVVADYGYGHVQVEKLQEEWGPKVKGCYFSPIRSKFVYNRERNMITADRNILLEEALNEIKSGNWIFPYGDPVAIEWLAQHCSNVVVTNRLQQGVVRKVFEKPYGKPNDGLLALNYARLAHLFSATSGFRGTASQGRQFAKPALASYKSSFGGGDGISRLIRGLHNGQR